MGAMDKLNNDQVRAAVPLMRLASKHARWNVINCLFLLLVLRYGSVSDARIILSLVGIGWLLASAFWWWAGRRMIEERNARGLGDLK